MSTKYYLRTQNCITPTYPYFMYGSELNKCSKDLREYIHWLHERACTYEDIIQEKNKIIEAKHKEIKRLNLCLLKRFFTIKNLKRILNSSDDFFEGIERDFPGTLERGREMLEYISGRAIREEASKKISLDTELLHETS